MRNTRVPTLWALLKVEFIIIASMMPPFEHFGSWLVDGFVMTLSMVISAFNYALQTSIVEEDGFLEFTIDSGRMLIRRIRNEFHLSLNTQTPEFNVTFSIDLHLEDCESISGPAPEQQDPPSYYLQSDQRLVLLGVPFELSCPFCAHSLEWGQICDHVEQDQVVIQQYGPDLSVEDLQANLFFIHEIIRAGSPVLVEPIYPDIHVPSASLIIPTLSPPDSPLLSSLSSSSSQHAYFDAWDSSKSPPL